MGLRIAFDLDGTLIDSLPQINEALNRGLADRGLPPISRETTRGFVGNGLSRLVTRSLAHLGADPAEHDAVSERVLSHYLTVPTDPDCVYPGAQDAMKSLRDAGHSLAICTNKPFGAALVALTQTGLLGHFDLVIGGDSLPTNKPHPQMLLACAPDIFVGDSEVDAETAQAANLPFLLFTKGYRKAAVSTLPHRATFKDHAHLPTLV